MMSIKNETGMAMPLVLIVMLVSGLLFTAVWQYSNSELRQVVSTENRTKAYYLARAGAEALAHHIQSNPEIINDILGNSNSNLSESIDYLTYYANDTEEYNEAGVKVGDIQLLVEEGVNTLLVTGIGTVNGVDQKASLLMRNIHFDGDMAFVITGDYETEFASAMTIKGNGIAKKKVKLPSNFYEVEVGTGIYTDGEYIIRAGEDNYPFPPDYFDSVTIPDELTRIADVKNGNFFMGAGNRYIVESISSNSNNSFEIATSSDLETILVVENLLDLKTTIKVTGNGHADIYILDQANLQTQGAITEVAQDAQLNIYLYDKSTLTLQAGSDFHGLIYGPEANVVMQAQPNIYGAMIVGRLSGNGANPLGGNKASIEYTIGFDSVYFQPIVSILNWIP